MFNEDDLRLAQEIGRADAREAESEDLLARLSEKEEQLSICNDAFNKLNAVTMQFGEVIAELERALRTGRIATMARRRDLTIEPGMDGRYDVYEHGTYPRHSVLAGQARRSFVDTFDTLEDAQRRFPKAQVLEHSSRPFEQPMSDCPPSWFDPADAGEEW